MEAKELMTKRRIEKLASAYDQERAVQREL